MPLQIYFGGFEMKKFIGVLFLVGVFFAACGNDSKQSKLAIIDIANATILFIAPGSNNEPAKLYKITDDNNVQEVSYYDENGKLITVKNASTAIYDVNETYVIVCFGNIGYLVRKTDGVVFSLENIGLPNSDSQSKNFVNAKKVQSDSMGNIYYVVSNDILKIDTSNPNNLTKVIWVEGSIINFCISPAGHTIYSNSLASGEEAENFIKKVNGDLIDMPKHVVALWVGLDNNIKYFDYQDEKIWNVSIDTNFQETTSSIYSSLIISHGGFLLKFDDRILSIISNTYHSDNISIIIEIETSSNSDPHGGIYISEISTIKNAVYSNDYYYLSGNDDSNQYVLLKVNSETNAVETLLSHNQYDIYKMTVDENNVVLFNAKRLSDGVKVIGQVSLPDNVSILNETLNTEITFFERIR
jgi:hypothetical protein